METTPESDPEEQAYSEENAEEEKGEKEEEQEVSALLLLLESLTCVYHPAPRDQHGPNQEIGEDCPDSYRGHSIYETRLLDFADNFQRQYSYLHPERNPLLLCALNECGVKKFVSTTLRLTPTRFPDLLSWQGCASFVADFLSLEPLESPVELPSFLRSPAAVLRTQRATCFEYSTMLCSLLLGANFDAYCVSGYAVREICLLDQSLQECPPMESVIQSVIREPDTYEGLVPEFKSRFLENLEIKKQEAEAAELIEQELEEEKAQQPCEDPLRGRWVHCWVLVLSGSRDVQENFFIDPLTGNRSATDDDSFLGIESIWNNFNYYVNKQDCSSGCAGLVYDVDDLEMWEPVLANAFSRKQLMLAVLNRKEAREEGKEYISDEEESEEGMPPPFDMPRSWVSCINITKKDLEFRWPGGYKVTKYKKAKLEKFALYLRPDGLLTRLTTYKDLDCTEAIKVKEWYRYRNDDLKERETNGVTNCVSECFEYGRRFHLIGLRRTGAKCHMEFSDARVDDLLKRVETPGEMTETFDGRFDYLYYRCAVFNLNAAVSNLDQRPLKRVVERFHRNKLKEATKDVAERVFVLDEGRIELTYHSEDTDRIFPTKRNFIKPDVYRKTIEFTPDMVSSFQANPSDKSLKPRTLSRMLVNLLIDEDESLKQINQSKKETRDILACRVQEEADIELHFSMWKVTGREMADHQMDEMELLIAEEKKYLEEKETEVLVPFLSHLETIKSINTKKAKQLYRSCMDELTQRLVEHSVLLQKLYEEVTEELKKKQLWYQENQLTMTTEQEEEYRTYCYKKIQDIQLAKKRLIEHKKESSKKCNEVDKKLQRHPRLCRYMRN